MNHPMSSRARLIRIVVGAVILGSGFLYQSWWGAIGILPLIGGLLGVCPLCKMSSKSCKKDACDDDKKPKSGGCCGGH